MIHLNNSTFRLLLFYSNANVCLFLYSFNILCFCSQPDNLLASVLAHPILTASGLQGRDHRFIPPSTAASAAASVLASLSTSQVAHTNRGHSSIHPESTMYRSDRTIIDRYCIVFSTALLTYFSWSCVCCCNNAVMHQL